MRDAKAVNADTHAAERIRKALIRAALDGYEQAAQSGLCAEGAWEAAISAMRQLDLRVVSAEES